MKYYAWYTSEGRESRYVVNATSMQLTVINKEGES